MPVSLHAPALTVSLIFLALLADATQCVCRVTNMFNTTSRFYLHLMEHSFVFLIGRYHWRGI